MRITFPIQINPPLNLAEYDITDSPAPSKLQPLGLINEWQSIFQVGRIALNYPSLVRKNSGMGQRIILLPGFLANASAMYPMKHFLNQIGYEAEDWGLGINLGNVEKYRNRMLQKLENEDSTEEVTLVGWSLGGVVAREVARMMPDRVSSVFTLGSPLKGPEYTVVGTSIYGEETSQEIKSTLEELDRTDPIQVPMSIVFSKNDNVVSWPACLDTSSANAKHYEVTSTHFSMLIDPQVWKLLAVHLEENLSVPA